MKTYWTASNKLKCMQYYVEIKNEMKRIITWESSGHWRSETGNQASYEDFLRGDWDEWIVEIYGENALLEMKQSVQDFKDEI